MWCSDHNSVICTTRWENLIFIDLQGLTIQVLPSVCNLRFSFDLPYALFFSKFVSILNNFLFFLDQEDLVFIYLFPIIFDHLYWLYIASAASEQLKFIWKLDSNPLSKNYPIKHENCLWYYRKSVYRVVFTIGDGDYKTKQKLRQSKSDE